MSSSCAGVGAQAHQLLGDIAAVGQDRGLLRQALRVDAGAVQQVGQLLAQALEEGRDCAGADFVHAGDQVAMLPAALAHFLGGDGAFALAERVQRGDSLGGGFQHGLGQRPR